MDDVEEHDLMIAKILKRHQSELEAAHRETEMFQEKCKGYIHRSLLDLLAKVKSNQYHLIILTIRSILSSEQISVPCTEFY